MKIDTMEDGTLRVKQLFNSIVLETENGQRMAVCFRDNGIEFGVSESYHKDDYVWFQAEKGKVIREGKQVPNKVVADVGLIVNGFCTELVEVSQYQNDGFTKCGNKAEFLIDGQLRCKLHARDKNGLDHAFMKSLDEGEHLRGLGLSQSQIDDIRTRGRNKFQSEGEQNES